MGAKLSRRDLLIVAPGLMAAVVAAPAPAAAHSPIIALYRQWHVVRDQLNGCGDDDATQVRLYGQMYEIECHINQLTCTSAADLAAKYDVETDCGGLEISDRFLEECKALLDTQI